MKKEIIAKLHSDFEETVQTNNETSAECWFARDIQSLLGYAKWENFEKVIEKAKVSCKNAGLKEEDHFLGIRKMVQIGSGSSREINDIALTRYACYLIAQNGDSSKDQVAFAQTYFATQTRKQELIEKRLGERERLIARKKLTISTNNYQVLFTSG